MIQRITVDEQFIEDTLLLRKPESTDMGLLEACSQNVNLFAEKMIGIKPYAWQAFVLNKAQKALLGKAQLTSREFAWLTSRQVGKSLGIAILCVWATVFNKAPGGVNMTTDVGIVSASDVQAKKLLYEMKKIMRRGDRFLADSYGDMFPLDKDNKGLFSLLLSDNDPNNTTTITFKPYDERVHGDYLLYGSKSGSSIKSYPPSASVLGETFSIVIIDEAGKTDRISDQFFYDYIYPTGNERDALRIYTSTPWVQSGFFFEKCHDEMSDTEVYVFTIDAVKLENPRYHENVMKVVDAMRREGKFDEVKRAYYCEFVQGEQNYFNPQKVSEMFDTEMQMRDSYSGPCDLGIDFGAQKSSESVITIAALDEKTGQVERLYHRKYKRGTDLQLIDDIKELMTRFNIQRIIPDECPAGAFEIARMVQLGWNVQPKNGDNKPPGMNFRREKVQKYTAFRSALNNGLIKSYPDPDLAEEMRALENSQTSTQSKIVSPPGYSDDLIDSLILATYFMVDDTTGKFGVIDWNSIDEDYDPWLT